MAPGSPSTSHTLLADLLSCLGVPHTQPYTDRRFASMPFRTLFGLGHLLREYGVESQGLRLDDTKELLSLPVPFLAQTKEGSFIIVTGMNSARASYLSEGEVESVPASELTQACTGIVMLARAGLNAHEPDYKAHRGRERMLGARDLGLGLLAAAFIIYLYASGDLWHSLSASLAILLNLTGLTLSLMLLAKGLGVKSKAIRHVCGVLQQGGCDSVLADKASSFLLVFHWSEVGMAYFSVSLLAMLIWPHSIPYLALCNACCLPFTLWSIWYQKARAKAWCTLCVGVQCTLWLIFFCFLGGGWFASLKEFHVMPLLLLGASYLTTLFAFNWLDSVLHKAYKPQEDNG